MYADIHMIYFYIYKYVLYICVYIYTNEDQI